jgi:mannose-6-phosphate isomerase
MCGFREIPEILKRLELFSQRAPAPLGALLGRLRGPLERGDGEGLRELLGVLFTLNPEERRALSAYTLEQREYLTATCPAYGEEWKTAVDFAALYPEDPAVIAPLYLNLVDLAPGEAIYLPAGVLHAYIEGFGVELMANSDNVLRGGLTTKHVDGEELAKILEFRPFRPVIVKPPHPAAALGEGPGLPLYTYPADCREFSLSVIRGTGGTVPFPPGGPHIFMVTRGKVEISCDRGEENLTLLPGESAFIAAGAAGLSPANTAAASPADPSPAGLSLSGDFTLYAAGAGIGTEIRPGT